MTTARKIAISTGLSMAAAAVALLIVRIPFIDGVELKTYDWRMRLTARPAAPSEDIVLVSINDDSVRRMAPVVGRWPWPRLVHASLIDYLSRAPAKVIVYDILFTEPDVQRFNIEGDEWTGAESDQALADSVAKAGNVVVAADAAAEGLVDASRTLAAASDARPDREYTNVGECVEPRPVLVPPFAALDRAARLVGHTLLIRDADGPLRRAVPFVRVNDEIVPALPVAAALLAQNRLDSRRQSSADSPRTTVDASDVRSPACPPLIPYRGPTVGENGQLTFRDHSFYDLFYSEQQILAGQKPEVDPSLFKDRIVVVGATASGTYEVQTSPFGQGIAGPEVHASVIDGLIRNRTVRPLETGSTIALTVGAVLALAVVGALAGVWVLAAAAALAALAILWTSVRFFAAGVWMPLVAPLVAVGLTFVGQLTWQYIVEGREKRKVKRLFSRYVPKNVYEQLIADPSRAALGGKRRNMTVLFSDVRGFTSMSEKATPEAVVGQLNDYFSRMVQVLFEHHGTLDKFVGDMVMGLFGAPLDDEDHAEHAVQTALAMSAALDALNREWHAAGRPQLDIGIGISTGDMVAGNIGSEAIMSYTVIGDTVNLGARLESLNKEYGTRIIISDATRAALKKRYDIRPLGEVTVKGKSKSVAIFEVRPA